MRPAIWADASDDSRNGLWVVESRWLDGEAGGAQGAAPPPGSRKRETSGALAHQAGRSPAMTWRCSRGHTRWLHPSTAAALMHPGGRGCSQAEQERPGVSCVSSSGLRLSRGRRMMGCVGANRTGTMRRCGA